MVYTQTQGLQWSGFRNEDCSGGCDHGRCSHCAGGEIDLGHTHSGCRWADEDHSHCVTQTQVEAACPNLGPVSSRTTSNASWDNGVQVACSYSSIDPSLIWDTNTLNQYFSDTAVGQIQSDWCNDSSRNVTDLSARAADCRTAIGNTNYASKLLAACQRATDWTTLGACVEIVRNSVQNNDATNASTARTMMQKYCRGGNGQTVQGLGQRNSKLCGCYNVYDFGIGDFSSGSPASCTDPDKQNWPGCSDIQTTYGGIIENLTPTEVNVIQAAIGNDRGRLSSMCTVDGRSATDVQNPSKNVLPYNSNQDQSILNLNMCQIITNIGVNVNSAVKLTCKMPVPPPAGNGSPAPSPGPSPGAIGGGEPDTPVDFAEDPWGWLTSHPIWLWSGGGGAFLLCCCCCLLLVVLMI
jgi:hypothetical protein